MNVSIIIATASRPSSLLETFRSLSAVEVPAGWSAEILLVENGTRNDAESTLSAISGTGFTTRYLFEPKRGKSHALNRALAEAKGEILLFSDDDVRFPRDWLPRMCAPILSGRADAVAGGVRLAPHLLRGWMTRTHRAWLASTADYLTRDHPSEMCGANMALHRRVLERVVGFDTNIGPGITGGGEESLLSWQVVKAGFQLIGAFDVEVEHHPSVDRLQYGAWVRAARLKGETRGYQLHHWFHQTLRYARLRAVYWNAKLFVRSLITRRPGSADEGIAPWELSYIEEVGKYRRYAAESRRPRLYPLNGTRPNP